MLIPTLVFGRLRRSKWFVGYVTLFVAACVTAYSALVTVTARVFSTDVEGVRDAQSMVRFAARRAGGLFPVSTMSFSVPEVEIVSAVAPNGVGSVAAYGTFDAIIGDAAGAEVRTVRVAAVSKNFFDVVGVASAAGQLPRRGDPLEYGVVFSDRGAARVGATVGKPIRLNGGSWTVRAVAARFTGLDPDPIDVFVPIEGVTRLGVSSDWLGAGSKWLRVVLRVDNPRQVDAPRGRLAAALQGEPVDFQTASVGFEPLNMARGSERDRMSVVLLVADVAAAVLLLLLLSNVAQLFVLRTLSRAHDLTVHTALGATPTVTRLIVVGESIVPLLAGALIGTVLGQIVATTLVGPTFHAARGGDATSFGVVLLTIVVGAAAAVVPSLTIVGRLDVRAVLDAGRQGSSQASFVSLVLFGSQVCLASAAMFATSVCAANVREAESIRYGYDTRHLYSVSAVLHMARPAREDLEALAATLRSVSGIVSVSVVNAVPMRTTVMSQVFARRDGRIVAQADAEVHGVDAAFFATAGLPVSLSSSDIKARWAARADLAVVSASLLRSIGGAGRVSQTCLALGSPDAQCRPIIGVADDANFRGPRDATAIAVYRPLSPETDNTIAILARSYDPPGAVVATLARETMRYSDRVSLDAHWVAGDLAAQRAPWQRGLKLLLIFCVLAIAIATVGVGSISFRAIHRRRRHIAIALALGAPPRHVLRIAFGHLGVLALASIAVGVASAAAVAHHYGALLLNARVLSAGIIGPAVCLSAAATLAGFIWPIISVRRIEPVESLKGLT